MESLFSLLPKMYRCPLCESDLLDIVYGLIAGPLDDNQIPGGCEWSDEAPTKACVKCDWRGGLGGRSWATEFTERWQIYDETSPNNVREEERSYNLKTMSNEELFEFGRANLASRFELVHRGIDPAVIDEAMDEELSMPLIRKEIAFVFYNLEAETIEQVCIYSAQRTMHEFEYLMHGFDDWVSVSTLQDFHDAVFAMKRPEILVWPIALPDEMSDEDSSTIPCNYGSPAIKALIEDAWITPEDMFDFDDGGFYETPIFWPHWFDPGFMLDYTQRPWLPR
jgi:hypothetical protein